MLRKKELVRALSDATHITYKDSRIIIDALLGILRGAIIVGEDGVIEIIGEGAVYFIDGSTITYTNVSELHCDDILSMHDIKLHVLTSGEKFDLIRRSPFVEEDKISNENNAEENI